MAEMSQDDIAAALAARRELGPEYDDAVAASLVERMSAEIDRRVDARLAEQAAARPVQRSSGPALALGLGSIGLGIPATGIIMGTTGGEGTFLTLVVWIVIAIVNIAFSHRHEGGGPAGHHGPHGKQ